VNFFFRVRAAGFALRRGVDLVGVLFRVLQKGFRAGDVLRAADAALHFFPERRELRRDVLAHEIVTLLDARDGRAAGALGALAFLADALRSEDQTVLTGERARGVAILAALLVDATCCVASLRRRHTDGLRSSAHAACLVFRGAHLRAQRVALRAFGCLLGLLLEAHFTMRARRRCSRHFPNCDRRHPAHSSRGGHAPRGPRTTST
jgi:hypothetical protein